MWKELKPLGGAGTRLRLVRWGRCVLALLLAVVALLVDLALDPWLDDREVWSLFYLAVTISAWWLGWRPAILTALLGMVLGIYFIIPPRHTWLIPHLYNWVGILTYAFVAGAIVVLVRTARRQQQRLREAARGLAAELDFSDAVIDSLPGLFYMLDAEGRMRRWNKRLETLSGYSAAELAGKPGLELVSPEDRDLVTEKLSEVFTTGRSQAEVHFWTRDGRRLLHLYTGRRFTHAGRTGLVGMGVDLSERGKAQAAQATLAAIVEHSNDSIVGEALDGTITSWNHGAERIFGYTAAEAIGRNISMLVPAELRGTLAEMREHLQRGEPVERTETERICKDGRRITLSLSASPIRDGEGRLIGLAKIGHDVTQLKKAEAQLHQQERLLRQVLQLLPVGVRLMDQTGNVVQQNPAAARIWGGDGPAGVMRLSELKGWWAASNQPIAPEQWASARALAQGEAALKEEVFIEGSDGARKALLHSALPIRNERGEITGAVIVDEDITERKLGEMALLNQNHRLALLQEAAVRLLSTSEPELILPEVFVRIAEYFAADIVVEYGLRPDGSGLTLRTSGGLEEATRRKLRHLQFGQGLCGVVAQTHEAITRAHIQEATDPMVQLVRSLGVRAYACIPLMVGEHLHGTLSFGSRLRDSFEPEDLSFFQTLAGCVALARERTELVGRLREHATELERRVQERTAQLRDAMTEMEQMSYSMIHDLRAPLRAIESFGGILARQAAHRLDPQDCELVAKMRTAATRMDALVREALNYNKIVREALPLQPVDMAALLRGIVATYPDFQPPKTEVNLAADLPTVLGNEAALTQCFSQLLDNAVKFAKPGLRPQIRIWAEEERGEEPGGGAEKEEELTVANVGRAEIPDGPQEAESTPCATRSPFIRLWVEDNGIGIEHATQATLFKLFQRLSTEGKGTGMGLAIVKKAVERMGGRVGVESEPGVGSRFWLALKCAPG